MAKYFQDLHLEKSVMKILSTEYILLSTEYKFI